MRGNRFVQILILLSLFLPAFWSCNDNSKSEKRDFSQLISLLEEGDLLFRRGTGVVGHIVTSMDRNGNFSHVGIVVKSREDWCVVHAVPHEPEFEGDFDRVKCEKLDNFVGRYPKAVVGLYRPMIEPQQVDIAVRNALRLSQKQVCFDHDYTLEDTTELYCTELIEYVYSLAGVSISEGRRSEVTLFPQKGIMPSDLTESSLLKPIY